MTYILSLEDSGTWEFTLNLIEIIIHHPEILNFWLEILSKTLGLPQLIKSMCLLCVGNGVQEELLTK